MRLVLISLDAVSARDAETLLNLPALGGLARSGVFCDRVQTVYPALTYPIHASIVTGCNPARHGIGHNEKYQPGKPPGERAWYWDAADIRATTLFQAAARAGRESAAILWPSTGHSRDIRYNFPETLALRGENQTLKVLRYGSAGWILKNELRYGRTRPSVSQPHLDRYGTLLCEKLIERQYRPGAKSGRWGDVEPSARTKAGHMPDLIALHLTDADAARHRCGVDSPEASEALGRLDEAVGRILDALARVGALQDTVVAVVSDHGQEDLERPLALDDWLREKGVPARAQSLGKGAYIRCERGDCPAVYELLRGHSEALGLSHVYTREELRAMGAVEDVRLAVEAAPGVGIVDRADQPLQRATHGFGPEHPGARCLLWLSGPPFRKNARLERARIIDVGPTLAEAAGLLLPEAQGSPLREAFDSRWAP